LPAGFLRQAREHLGSGFEQDGVNGLFAARALLTIEQYPFHDAEQFRILGKESLQRGIPAHGHASAPDIVTGR
jgi:hypothetical protein